MSLGNVLRDHVIANRILADQDVVDAYGHVAVRHQVMATVHAHAEDILPFGIADGTKMEP